MPKSAEINFWRQMGSVCASKLLNALGVILLIAVLNTAFSVEDIGVFFFFYVSVNFLSKFVGGVGEAIRKRVSAREGKNPEYLAVGTVFALVFQTVVSVLILSLYLLVPEQFLPDTLQRAGLNVILSAITLLFAQSIGKLMLNYNSGLGYPSRSEWFGRALPGVLFLVLAIFFTVYDSSLSVILLAGTASYTLSAAIMYASTRPKLLVLPRREHAESVFDFGKWSILQMISNNVYNSADVLLLGILVTSTTVGFYESSNSLAGLLYVVPYGFYSVGNVMISGLDAEGRRDDILSVLQESLRASSIVPVMSFFMFLGFGEFILGLVFGEQYQLAYWYLVGLGLIKVLSSYRKPLQGLNYGTDKPEIQFYANVYAMIANFTTVLPLIWYVGGLGVVISTVMAAVVRLAAVIVMSKEYVYDIDIRWTLFVTYSTGIVLLLVSKTIEGMFELGDVEYILLLAGFAVAYLASNLSLISIDLSNPAGDSGETGQPDDSV
jgi:O-antigen/teichoic acid export membrane protein